MPTTIIFVRPLCTGPAKQVWSFTRLSTSTPADSNAWRSIQTSPGCDRAELHDVHRRADRHAHRRFGEAERFDHRPLALGGAAVVRAHRGEQERPGPTLAEPIAGRFGDRRDVGDAAAAGRDADVALRHVEIQPIERGVHRGRNIRNRVRNQFLADAEEFHSRTFNWRRRSSL